MNLSHQDFRYLKETDPRLTGNVKIIVSPDSSLSIGSIPANAGIAGGLDDYRINPESNYGADVYRYLESIPAIVSDVYDYSDLTNHLLKAGPRTNDDSQYPTSVVRYFAPVWSRDLEDFPDAFVVFRVPNFVFDNQNLTSDEFASNVIGTGKIVGYWNFADGEIRQYLKNHYSMTGEDVYVPDNNPEGYKVFGINWKNGLYTNSYILGRNYTDVELADRMQDVDLLHPYMFNFEFLVEDKEFSSQFSYYGVWIDTAREASVVLDWEEHNRYLVGRKISDWYYSDLDGEIFQSTHPTNAPIYATSFDNHVFNDTYAPAGNMFFTVSGKSGFPMIISEIDTQDNFGVDLYTIRTNQPIVDLGNFIGIDHSKSISVPGQIIPGKGSNALTIVVNRDPHLRAIFNNGDYLSIRIPKADGIGWHEWRLIAGKESCCSSDVGCFFEGIECEIQSTDFDLLYGSGGAYRMANVRISNTDLVFEEGTIIDVSSDMFDSVQLPIEKVYYNYTDGYVELTLVDKLGTIFLESFASRINHFSFKYSPKSYWFAYFNNYGTVEEVILSISNASKKFINRYFDIVPVGKSFVIRFTEDGYDIDPVMLVYNFSGSFTPSYILTVNGVTMNGTVVTDRDGNIIFRRERGSLEFIGGSGTYGHAAIPKGIVSTIDPRMVIKTKKGYSTISHYRTSDGQYIYKGSYVDSPIRNTSGIIGYNHIGDYSTISIKDKHDRIIANSSGNLNFYKRFNGTIRKCRAIQAVDL